MDDPTVPLQTHCKKIAPILLLNDPFKNKMNRILHPFNKPRKVYPISSIGMFNAIFINLIYHFDPTLPFVPTRQILS